MGVISFSPNCPIEKRDEKLQQLISSTRKEIAKEIEKIDNLAIARSLHLQAAASLQDSPGHTAFDGLNAAVDYASCENEGNLISVLRLVEQAMPRVEADDFQMFDISGAYEAALAALERLNATGRYNQEIRLLKTTVADAKTRRKPNV